MAPPASVLAPAPAVCGGQRPPAAEAHDTARPRPGKRSIRSGLTDVQALRIVALTFIVLHAASGVAGVYAFAQGVGAAVWWNVAVRVLMVGAFIYYGLVRTGAARTAG